MTVNLYDSVTVGRKINFELLHTESDNFIPHLSFHSFHSCTVHLDIIKVFDFHQRMHCVFAYE